jgi:ParB family protein of integrating conjugative element (PFGI_1 class)
MKASPDSSPMDRDTIAPDSARAAQAAQRLGLQEHRTREAHPQLTSTIRLKVTDVTVYERNPRRASHERIVELKESIRVNGIEQIIAVTRRPGEARYVVAKGGNSRLTAARALHDETGEDRFLHYDFLYVPYPGEAKLLAAHLRENDLRADLCFWDKANGYLALKADLERERGTPLSLREFSRALEEEGTPVSHVLLSLFQFAVDRLSALGTATEYLSRRALVDVIQPTIGALTRLARRLGFEEMWLQQHVINPELQRIAAAFESAPPSGRGQPAVLDVAQLAEALRQRCAHALGVARSGLDRMCLVLDRNPDVTPDALRDAGAPDRARPALVPDHRADGGDASKAPDVGAQPSADTGDRQSEDAEMSRTSVLTRAPAADENYNAAASGLSALSDGMPEQLQDEGRPEDAFRGAVESFAHTCGLDGCVREAPSLPYGFMVEPPEPDVSRLALDSQARDDEAALNRYLGWWWLVSLSRQNTACGLELVPRSSVYARMARDDEYWTRVCDASIGEPLLADRMDVMFDVMLNPERLIGQWWSDLMKVARAFRASHPERFTPPRWMELDADERLRRGEGA